MCNEKTVSIDAVRTSPHPTSWVHACVGMTRVGAGTTRSLVIPGGTKWRPGIHVLATPPERASCVICNNLQRDPGQVDSRLCGNDEWVAACMSLAVNAE